MTIWKFPLQIQGVQVVEMPTDARILSVQTQGYRVCLWAIVDPALPRCGRCVRMFGTGHTLPREPDYDFAGTIQMLGGELVWHVFVDSLEQPLE